MSHMSIDTDSIDIEVTESSISIDDFFRYISFEIAPDDREPTCSDAQHHIDSTLSAFLVIESPQALYVALNDGYKYTIKSELTDISNDILSLTIFLKPSGPLRPEVPFNLQLNVIRLPIDKWQEKKKPGVVKDILSYVVTPYFDCIASDAADIEASSSILSAKKKLHDLNVSLNYVDSQIVVPDLLSVVPMATLTSLREPISDSLLQDTTFLNELTQIANAWIKQVLSITHISRPSSEDWSMSAELNFWESMERALQSLQRQIEQPEIKRAIEILTVSKRFQTTFAFQNNLNIGQKLEETRIYNAFLKELPLDDLLHAKNAQHPFSAFETAVASALGHLKRWRSIESFPLPKLIELIELLLSEISHALIDVLSAMSIMAMPLEAFVQFYELQSEIVFDTIKDTVNYMTNVLRELMRKRSEKFMIIRINLNGIEQVQNRAGSLYRLKVMHHALLKNLIQFSARESLVDKLSNAFNKYVVATNYFDFSVHGSLFWAAEEDSYHKVHSSVSEKLASYINGKIGQCNSFGDFIGFFKTVRDTASLMSIVDDSHKVRFLSVAHDELKKVTTGISADTDASTSSEEDYSRLVCVIKTRHSFRLKVSAIIRLLTSTMGENWALFAFGSQIDSEVVQLQKALELADPLENWIAQTRSLTNKSTLDRRILVVSKGSGVKKIAINYSTQLIAATSEISELLNLDLPVPIDIVKQIRRSELLAPLIHSIEEHIELLELSMSEYRDNGALDQVLEPIKRDILQGLIDLTALSWNIVHNDAIFVQNQSDDGTSGIDVASVRCIESFLESASSLFDSQKRLDNYFASLNQEFLSSLITCEYSHPIIQRHVNQAHDSAMAFVRKLTKVEQFEEALLHIIRQALYHKCLDHLNSFKEEARGDVSYSSSFDRSVHSLQYANGRFYVDPPVASIRSNWLSKVDTLVEIISNVTFQGFSGTRRHVIENHTKDFQMQLTHTLTEFETVLDGAEAKLKKWNALGEVIALDLDSTSLFEDLSLDDSFNKISSILSLESLYNDPRCCIEIGSLIEVSYIEIRSVIASSFEKLKVKTLHQFQNKVLESSSETLHTLRVQEAQLSRDVDWQMQFRVILTFVASLLQSKGEIVRWRNLQKTVRECSRLLVRNGSTLPSNWIYADQFDSIITNLELLISKRMAFIDQGLDLFQEKLTSEMISCNENIDRLSSDWLNKRPISGSMEPGRALSILEKLQRKLNELDALGMQLMKVSQELNLVIPMKISFHTLQEDIIDLKLVWQSLKSSWDALEEIKAFHWSEFQPKKISSQLEGLLLSMKSLPALVRHYSAFSVLEVQILSHIDDTRLCNELKDEAFKPRHWRRVFELAGIEANTSLKSLRVSRLFDLGLKKHETFIRAILQQAREEKVVEEALNAIEIGWSTIVFETFNFNDRCRLVRNWSSLYETCQENLGTLSSMKSSAWHGEFEERRSEIESRLINLVAIFDIWIEVQKSWTYLDGVFSDNSEMKALLPTEAARFANISFEFFNILKRVLSLSLVMEILTIKDLKSSLVKLKESLELTKKSLADYLEKQREYFPRFYFLGNEDLLELIGGSTDIKRMNRHIKSMFLGIESLQFNKDSQTITSVTSPEGEVLILANPVSLIKHQQLHQWLTELEHELKLTVASCIEEAYEELSKLFNTSWTISDLMRLIEKYPSQALNAAFNIDFGRRSDVLLEDALKLQNFYSDIVKEMISLSRPISNSSQTKKIESLIIELIHHRDVSDALASVALPKRVSILHRKQIFRLNPDMSNPLDKITIEHGRCVIKYGYEYHGIVERLAITPLVENCYLAMTQALAQGLGGSPFGPAGTGKTESIKALGLSLGRMVLVFNCDESFDYKSMKRIFLGLSKVGCWGCFDEFNRLSSSILSALSSSIEAIQKALNRKVWGIEQLQDKDEIHPFTGLFVTMNPGYIGRNELPENIKRLFRSFCMDKPDSEQIVDVLLASQGIVNSKELSSRIVGFFNDIQQRISSQKHYDFGLRAIKGILRLCGVRKSGGDFLLSIEKEQSIVASSLQEALLPKLVSQDTTIFDELLVKHFDRVESDETHLLQIEKSLKDVATTKGFHLSDSLLRKALQIFQMQKSHHGMMLVGCTGSGKSTLLRLVHEASSKVDNIIHETFILDCKALSKEEIFGSLDEFTREWTDGLLTSFLRKVLSNLKGEQSRRMWIIFDGDVDPDWAESLNSVLDDNKVLTLPNGERLEIPGNVTILFEVDNIDHATLATISRCGMIWFDHSLLDAEMLWRKFLLDISSKEIETVSIDATDLLMNEQLSLQKAIAKSSDILGTGFFAKVSQTAMNLDHIMNYSWMRAQTSFMTFYESQISRLLDFKNENPTAYWDSYDEFVLKGVFLSLVWAYSGDCPRDQRVAFVQTLAAFPEFSRIEIPDNVFEFEISLGNFEWYTCSEDVEIVDLDPHQVMDPTTIIPTVDTIVHEKLIYSLVNKHSPLLLCGPPGSGKTMTFLKALRKSPNLELIPLNFSKDTSAESLLSSLEQHCCYKQTNKGLTLTSKIHGKWTVIFCDEINLPSADKYGTQRVISLIRQMVELQGFWSHKHNEWVALENVQFVGACNNPHDPGRRQLSERFLRHVCVVMVDYPGETSMTQIYESFNYASLKCAPSLRGLAKPLTAAMLGVYLHSKSHLTSAVQAHYIYSPRELTRWCRGILETLQQTTYDDMKSLIRLWYHEGLRLFSDRLSKEAEIKWTKELLRESANAHFSPQYVDDALEEPILFSNWLTSVYEPVTSSELTAFAKEKLRIFSEEEVNVDLVLFDDMLDHILRIDRVLRQHQGHMILVGPCTSGKSTLTKFVAWMNGISVVQLLVHSGYTISDFQSKLREVLKACLMGDKICFLIDESSILETSFIERMNTLLANSEVPGLFEGEDYEALMKLCERESAAQGHLLDNEEELYSWFRSQVSANLHVVFTLSDVGSTDRVQVNSSPALFNRCVLSWMGDWSSDSLEEIANKKFQNVALDRSDYECPPTGNTIDRKVINFRDAIVNTCVFVHKSMKVYPGKFMSFLNLFLKLYLDKEEELNSNQRHIISGLDKLKEAVLEITSMKALLSEKQQSLLSKEADAKDTLDKMIQNQNEAERKREFSVATQEELEKQEVQINKRRAFVLQELELAEPDVLEAQKGVQNIKKQHLTEIRSMSNPPAAVKMTMESVCVLLGYDVKSWRDVQLVVRKDDFIANIVSFDSETSLTTELREYMEKTYLNRPEFNFETVDRASKACGPLLQWVVAQLKYHSILESVLPLKDEVQRLEVAAKHSKAQLIAIAEMIQELEDSIKSYKASYSDLIREAERIRVEMEQIEQKVSRSSNLIENLTSERTRWESNIAQCAGKRNCIVGNAILSAAFAVYCGPLDQTARDERFKEWKARLNELSIPYDKGFTPLTYLAIDKRISNSENNSSPLDLLWEQNLAIKEWSDYSYIIDPTGDVLEYLLAGEEQLAIRQTSFLDKSFMRHVEDAMRFGGIVLITHAEYYDPRLDPILRKDIKDAGGRKVILLESKAVDISDNFRMILFTKNHLANPPPSLAARISVLNFTITRGNFQRQASDMCLQQASPDLYKKEKELVLLQRAYQTRSHTLRQELLDTLSNMAGTILENNNAVNTLESIKSESLSLEEKYQKSSTIIQEAESVKAHFKTCSDHLSRAYEILMKLSSRHVLYNFSFKSVLGALQNILSSKDGKLDDESFIQKLYNAVFVNVGSAMKLSDRLSLALALFISYYRVTANDVSASAMKSLVEIIGSEEANEKLFSILKSFFDIDLTTVEESQQVAYVSSNLEEAFGFLMPLIKKVLQSESSWDETLDKFTSVIFGMPMKDVNLFEISDLVSTGKFPIMIAESDHIDLTQQIEALANASSRELKVIAMGSEDNLQNAFHSLRMAMKSGGWLLLQNVQLASAELNEIEQIMDSGKMHDNFALFLTCSLTASNIPPSLVLKSSVFVYEETPKYKRMLVESFRMLLYRMNIKSDLARRLCLLVSWYHCVIQEQLKYVPMAFSEKYDVNEVDLIATASYLNSIFEGLSKKLIVRTSDIPWSEIAFIMGSIIYGGKISSKKDAKFCKDLAAQLFVEGSCEKRFTLPLTDSLTLPVEHDEEIEVYENWITSLPDPVPLDWMGLNDDAVIGSREYELQSVVQRAAELTT